ncbi:Rossmann-fold NAD(P)-binding domain-containing protein [Streptomyces albidoflavus]|uniref:hypothetical protein n=1 Tax=Streptomyces albidoflavus TaxID=1886 RepID=UPI00267DEDF4
MRAPARAGHTVDVVVRNAGHMALGAAEASTTEQPADLYDVDVLGSQRVNRCSGVVSAVADRVRADFLGRIGLDSLLTAGSSP